MPLTQNHIEHLKDLLERGEITAEQANVEKVKMARVQLVTGRVPADVRRALNAAVRRGELAHWKKDGKKPEVYFHPNFDYLAKEARSKHERNTISAIAGVMAKPVLDA